MTKYYFLFAFTFIMGRAMAQTIPGNAVPTIQFRDVNGRFISAGENGVQGSPYVFAEFGMGKLMMTNGMEAIDSNLNYSLADHKLYFIKNKGMYLVNQPVKYFQLNGVDKDNNNLVKNFASGYPAIENNSPTTFYEVIGENASHHLLKYTKKSIKETTVYGSAPIKEYTTDHMYCVYSIADKKMLLVGSSLTLKNLKKILPEKAAQLDQLNESLKLNLKKEEDAKTLFEKLN
jgi:hypothetical protein